MLHAIIGWNSLNASDGYIDKIDFISDENTDARPQMM